MNSKNIGDNISNVIPDEYISEFKNFEDDMMLDKLVHENTQNTLSQSSKPIIMPE